MTQSKQPLFRVYYASGTAHGLKTFDGDFDNVGDTPVFGVLLIVQRDKGHGRKIVSGGDFYVWRGGEILWESRNEVFQYMSAPGMMKRYLWGIMADSTEWNQVYTQALGDPDFPPKTGYDRYEAKG